MALRVLLADESSTIKKVFQLALQDYAVEVKPVALGVDVEAVALDFRPDIIFADILLQKRNGYEVCAELKANEHLRSIPVVLMWSGFMELDRDKFEACGADGKLEKPFDVAQLRKSVQELVSKTKTQSLSNYLEFPDTPEIEEQTPSEPPPSFDSEEEDDFRPVSIPKINTQNEKFQVNVSPDEEDEAEFIMKSPPAQMGDSEDLLEVEDGEEDEDSEDFAFHRPGTERTPEAFSLSPNEIREIVERLAPKIIEEIAWKIVPDMAAQIIEREIKNLLAEKESEVTP